MPLPSFFFFGSLISLCMYCLIYKIYYDENIIEQKSVSIKSNIAKDSYKYQETYDLITRQVNAIRDVRESLFTVIKGLFLSIALIFYIYIAYYDKISILYIHVLDKVSVLSVKDIALLYLGYMLTIAMLYMWNFCLSIVPLFSPNFDIEKDIVDFQEVVYLNGALMNHFSYCIKSLILIISIVPIMIIFLTILSVYV